MFRILKLAYPTLLLFHFLCARVTTDDVARSNELFSFLNGDDGWVHIDEKQGAELSIKSFQKMDLVAFRVQKKISIQKEIIKDIVMDVKNYARYFRDQKGSTFQEIMKTEDWVDGHHYISIDLPFISDREYYFRVQSGGYFTSDSNSIVHWYLKKYENKLPYSKSNDSRGSMIIDYGAGTWAAEKGDDDGYMLSYKLFLDPGGSIPDFAVELMNKTSIVNIFNNVLAEASKRNVFADQ